MSTFYKVTTPTGKINYLLGTKHAGTEKILLPIEIKEAFENSSSCLLESDLAIANNEEGSKKETAAIQELQGKWASQAAQFQGSEANKPYIDFAFKHFKNKFGDKYPDDELKELLNKYLHSSGTPMLLAFGLLADGTEPQNNAVFLDAQLLNQAKICKKQLIFLETLSEQTNVTYGWDFSYQEHLEFFNFIIDYLDKGGKKFMSPSQLEELYLAEDIKAIQAMYSPILTEDSPPSVKKYIQGYTSNRDIKMAADIKKHFEMGGVFAAVGTIHLPNIIEILSAENCTIEPVNLSERIYTVSDLGTAEKIKNTNNELPISFFNQNRDNSLNCEPINSKEYGENSPR